MKRYADIHNSGLDYIKSDAQRTTNRFTQKYLHGVLEKYVISIYGKDDAHKIMQEIAPMENLVFNGHIPSLTNISSLTNTPSLRQTSSNSSNSSSSQTNIAIAAANECMDKIKNHLNAFHDENIFDNKYLLEDLHTIISKTYEIYVQKCSSDIEKQSLAQSLGVLYGSIEYWTNSENVEYWSRIKMENENSSEYVSNSTRAPKKEDKKDDKKDDKKEDKKEDKKLSKKEYLEVIAAADTVGAFLGIAIASGPAAIAASAAAALYYDVE